MDVKTVRKKLFHAAQLQMQLNKLMGEIEKDLEFENGNELLDNVFCGIDWQILKIYYGCQVVDGKLYDSGNHLLSRDGCCMNDPLGYFVNQSTGYCDDDYYGTMFFQVDDKGTFVAVSYSC